MIFLRRTTPKGSHCTGHFKASGGRFCRETRVRKRCVKSVCTSLTHTSVWSRFRSELASICVSEAEAFTYERECSSAPFLLVFHAIGFARALKTKQRIGCRGALTVTTLSRFRSRESAWGAVRLGTFAVLERVWRRVTFAALRPECARKCFRRFITHSQF